MTALGVEQREGEQPELVVVALDKSHRLGRGSRVKTYLTMAYSDVVSSLVSAAGLSASTDSSQPTFDYLLQVSSDLEFLNEMASRSGFDWWVDGTTLNFKKPASGTTVELTLGDALRNFSVYASGHAPGTVLVYGWDRDAQQTLTGTASSATLTASSDLATTVAEPDSAFGQATLITAGLAGSTQEEVTQLSQALIDWAVASSVRASGTTDVDPNLKLGTSVSISDAGPLSGSYPVTRVEHTYRPRRGFLTRFWSGGRVPSSELRWERALWATAGAGDASPGTGGRRGHQHQRPEPDGAGEGSFPRPRHHPGERLGPVADTWWWQQPREA